MHVAAVLALALVGPGLFATQGSVSAACPAQQGLNAAKKCVPCADAGCFQCQANYKRCTRCAPVSDEGAPLLYLTKNGSCATPTQARDCDLKAKPILDAQGYCIKCRPGMLRKAGSKLCIHCNGKDDGLDCSGKGLCLDAEKCTTCPKAGSCTACSPGYFPKPKGYCYPCPQNSDYGGPCLACPGGAKCAKCTDGYRLSAGKCVQCSTGCAPDKDGFQAGTCTASGLCKTCSYGYGLDPLAKKGTNPCKKCADKDCIECYKDYRKCTFCRSGSVLENTGKCGTCKVSGCGACPSATAKTCSACAGDYIYFKTTSLMNNGTKCAQCADPYGCKDCTGDVNKCKACYDQRLYDDHYTYYWLNAGKCLAYRVYFPSSSTTTTSAAY